MNISKSDFNLYKKLFFTGGFLEYVIGYSIQPINGKWRTEKKKITDEIIEGHIKKKILDRSSSTL